jgi:hypothetical protein
MQRLCNVAGVLGKYLQTGIHRVLVCLAVASAV